MSTGLVLSTVWQGLLWGILALGVYITYRVLDVADLTVEGSYPLGAAVAVSFIAGGGSPVIAVVLAFLAGSVAGIIETIPLLISRPKIIVTSVSIPCARIICLLHPVART